jgi:hypothetical protein
MSSQTKIEESVRPIAELIKEINDRLEEILTAGDMVVSLENKTGCDLGLLKDIKNGKVSLVLVPTTIELTNREDIQRFIPFPTEKDGIVTRVQLNLHFDKR